MLIDKLAKAKDDEEMNEDDLLAELGEMVYNNILVKLIIV
jgi:hypothetical protein